MGADLRSPAGLLDRRRRRRSVEPGHRVGGHGRGERLAQHLLGRRHVQVHRRRQDVDEHGSQGHAPRRPHRDSPEEPRHRLRGGARAPVLRQRRARRLQDDRRREDLDQVAGREGGRQGDRRGGHRDGSGEAGDPVRGHLRQGAQALDVQPGRAGQRDLQDDRRGQDVDEADRRACPAGMLGRIGLDIYPKNPLILYANIENGNKPGMSDADRAGGAARREVERRHDRRGGLPDRRRREDVEESEPGQAEDRRRPGLLLHGRPRRSERRQPRLRSHRRRDGVEGRREDVGDGVPVRRRQPRDVDRPEGLEAHDSRLRPRDGDHLRRRQELVPPRRTAAGAVLRDRRGHAGALQRLRRPAGQRLEARAEHQAVRPARRGAAHRLRGLADHGRRRRDVQRRGPGHRPLPLQRVAVRLDLADRPVHRRAEEHPAPRPGAPLQLDGADSRLAARPERRLPRGEQAAEVGVARRRVGGGQPRPDDQRPVEADDRARGQRQDDSQGR